MTVFSGKNVLKLRIVLWKRLISAAAAVSTFGPSKSSVKSSTH